jgi:hypothetical protein
VISAAGRKLATKLVTSRTATDTASPTAASPTVAIVLAERTRPSFNPRRKVSL